MFLGMGLDGFGRRVDDDDFGGNFVDLLLVLG
jgi:hypothetical protein